MVYIKEAHAIDSIAPTSFEGIEDPVTDEERHEVCVRCVDDLGIPIPALVDDMQDSVNAAYGAFPDRLYLVGLDGTIAYAGGPGPMGFSTDELEQAIVKELASPTTPRSRLLAALDTDGDGKLSAKEIAGASEALKKLDADGDGELSPAELGAAPKAKPAPAPDAADPRSQAAQGMIRRLDSNKDGKLAREELPERMRARFEDMDADKDGFIDEQEMAAVMAARAGGGGGGRVGRRGGGGDR